MLGANYVVLVVEIIEISGPYIDRAYAEPGFAGIDAVKIDETLQRGFQLLVS
jgi:hypothetical protein